MSLNWDLTAIADNKEKCWIEVDPSPSYGGEVNENGKVVRMNPTTEALIFGCMIVGIGTIDDNDAPVFAARLDLYQRVHGDLMVGPDGPYRITAEDVFDHIGLSCNVSRETDAAWVKRQITDDLKRDTKRLTRELLDREVPVA